MVRLVLWKTSHGLSSEDSSDPTKLCIQSCVLLHCGTVLTRDGENQASRQSTEFSHVSKFLQLNSEELYKDRKVGQMFPLVCSLQALIYSCLYSFRTRLPIISFLPHLYT